MKNREFLLKTTLTVKGVSANDSSYSLEQPSVEVNESVVLMAYI